VPPDVVCAVPDPDGEVLFRALLEIAGFVGVDVEPAPLVAVHAPAASSAEQQARMIRGVRTAPS
jgi:hypothetical protein